MSTGDGGALRIQLLGPVRAWRADRELTLGAARQRAVLGMLAARANQPVSRDELIDGIWGPEPPASAVNGVHIYIAGLRRALEPRRAHRAPGRIVLGSGQGYQLLVEPGQVDVMAFEANLERARKARTAGDLAAAAQSLDAALGLWQASPLPEIRGPWAEVERVRLSELRLTAIEERLDVLLAQGRHNEAVVELAGLVRGHPLRERFRGQLMLALYRSGRQAEALELYAGTRRILVEELGIEPSPALRDLHAHILGGHIPGGGAPLSSADPPPEVVHAPATPIPQELPPDVEAFTGRNDELAVLDGLLPAVTATALVISVVCGTAGVGKTALAVHWAHRVRDRFPDGQLYLDLRGYDPGQPMSPDDALARFLRSLGVPERDVPADLDERSARYRSLLNGRRVLVVLDNAAAPDQVYPLLPGTASCAVIVTSRDPLTGLVARHGARRLELDLLPPADAAELLRALIGERVHTEPEPAAALARQCARLPLALRVAAEFAASRPAMTISQLTGELADERRRLSLLDADGDPRTAIRSVFSWSYRHLPADAARAFRLLGPHPGPDIGPSATAALTATTLEHSQLVLDQLSCAHLIYSAQPGRYGLHDLLRAYAKDVAHDDPDETEDALTRVFDHYLATASAAMNILFPAEQRLAPGVPALGAVAASSHVTSPASARVWLDAELANLVSAVAYCADNGRPGYATRLAATLFRYLDDGHYSDAIVVHSHACLAAQRMDDRAAEAIALGNLGVVAWRQGRYDQAVGFHERALALSQETGDHVGQGRALGNLGLVHWQHGRYPEAASKLAQALALFREIGDRTGEARTLSNLGILDWQQERYAPAASYHQQALALYRDMGDGPGEARALGNLGSVYVQQGRYPQAAECQRQALALFREIGYQVGGARALSDLGLVHARQGHHDQAADCQRKALALFREADYPIGEAEALHRLGEVLLAVGRTDEARSHLRHALARYADLGLPEAEQVRARLTALTG
ncbi:MAG TPA: tetratricopeptide repeat protein [Streptosporangiaceae bacterium]